MKIKALERILAGFVCGALLLVPGAGSAQLLPSQTATAAVPTVYGVCVYVVSDTSYYSTVFPLSATARAQAGNTFRQYALAQANGAPLKGAGCRWGATQAEISAQKDADKKLLGQPGRSAKGVETGWAFNPATAAATTPSAIARSAAVARPAVVTTPAVATPTVAVPVSATTVPTTAAATVKPVSTTGVTGSTSSISGNAASTLDSTKATATQSVNTTMNTMASSANEAIQGLFKKHSAKGATDPAAPGGHGQGAGAGAGSTGGQTQGQGQVAAAAAPAPLGFADTDMTATSAATTPAVPAKAVSGLIADVAGNDVIINVGTQAGVQVGTKLLVMHPNRTVKDPTTGKVLRTIEDKIGELTITNSDAVSASGTFSGQGTPKVGDAVRTPATQ